MRDPNINNKNSSTFEFNLFVVLRMVKQILLSIKDAKDGNYDDAVSNAYGSNIFNLCIALGIPLFLYTTIYDTVIELDKRTMEMIFKIWIWFVGLTIVSIYTYYFGKGINKTRSVAMVISYIVFIVYVFFLASSISPGN